MAKSVYDYEVNNKNYNENNKLRVAVYTRVSTNDQFMNWAWIEAQKAEIKKLIKANKDKYDFKEKKNYYEDWGQSWALEHRPELDRLIDDIANWEIDIIIVYKIDRLFRKLLLLLQFIDEISKSGVFIKSIHDNIDTSDKMWMVMLQFMWIIWDIERDNIRLRTIDWNITKARQWFYVWWWKTPFGYDLHPSIWWKKLKVNTDEAKVVNRIFDMYVNKGNTLWEIASILKSEWIPTRDDRLKEEVKKENADKDKYREKHSDIYDNDDEDENYEFELNYKKWTKKENDWKWYASSIRKILRNKMYIWFYEYWKTTKEWNKDTMSYDIVPNLEDNIVRFKCDDILKDASLFDEAQKILDRNLKAKPKSKYLFSWLMKCWLCWYSYNWYKSSKWTLHYRCKWGMSSSNLDVKCKNSEISEDLLFKYCWSELDKNLSDPEKFKAVVFDEEKNKELVADLNRRISKINTLIVKKKNNLENAIEMSLETTWDTKQIYLRKRDEYQEEITKLELESKDLRREISIIKSNEKKRDDIKNFYKEHEEAVKNLTDERKRQLIKKYISSILKNPWKLKMRFNIIDDLELEEWETEEDKSLKTSHDFFDKRSINIRDTILSFKDKKKRDIY